VPVWERERMPVDALVLVPGLGLGPEAWQPTLAALDCGSSPGLRTAVVPLPGYGVPADRSADLRPEALAGRLLEQVPQQGRFVLAGHSASCQVVARAAGQAPYRVAGLLLVGPTTDPRARGWPRLAGRWLATAARERPGQVPALVRQYRRTTLRSMARAMEAARWDRIDETLSSVDCPALVVRGRHDRICPQGWAESLTRTVTLPAGGHMVPLTHGALVARAVGELVARVGG
jgi:pimeloyl-ACP methyl ester carboxylesterase